ncbi:MAG: hypothetical protein ATN35_06170 [Epulopiscium sp. Nele67-Bin004]|nr:MAG: hypothetical protein ATN35_06170 [Epulopiscium sp. Nele67-Bin004]
MDNDRALSVMDSLNIVYELIEEAPTIIFGGGAIRIDRDILREHLERAIQSLPTEVSQAYWLMDERERIISEAHKDADNIRNDAEIEMKRLIHNNQITLEAQRLAEELVSEAKKDAREMQMMGVRHADEKLKAVEFRLKETLNYIHEEVRQFEDLVSETIEGIREERNQIKETIDRSGQE